jgi:hypothetical protein
MRTALTWALLAVASVSIAADTLRTEAAGLRFSLPRTWRRVPTVLETRAAEYRIPPAAGDAAETEFVLLFAGEDKGGDAGRHLERWNSRFVQPDGRSSRDVAVVTNRSVNDLRITAIDLTGTYVGSRSGPGVAGVSGFRILGAVVEGKGGPWVFELFGPTATVGQVKPDFDALLGSLEAHR